MCAHNEIIIFFIHLVSLSHVGYLGSNVASVLFENTLNEIIMIKERYRQMIYVHIKHNELH